MLNGGLQVRSRFLTGQILFSKCSIGILISQCSKHFHENDKLARVTIYQLYYDNMEDKALKTFVDPASYEDSSGPPVVTNEPTFHSEHEEVYQTSSFQFRRGSGWSRGVGHG